MAATRRAGAPRTGRWMWGSRHWGWLAAGTACACLVLVSPSLPATTADGDCTTTCYVAAGGDDAANHGTSPADAFATMQKALDTVADGGTVVVGAGTFAGATVSRSVTLQGAQVGVDARNRSATETVVSVPAAGAGLTITGTSLDVAIDGFRFVAATTGAGAGVTVAAGAEGDLAVLDSGFVNLVRGVDASLGTMALEARRDHFTGITGTTAAPGRPLSIGAVGSGAPATVADSILDGPGVRHGIVLGGGAAGSQIHGNVITSQGLVTGLCTPSCGVGVSIGSSVAAGGTSITRNAILANNLGSISTSSTAPVDATCNWWGATTGPPASGINAIGGSGAANVTREPWLTSNDLGPSAPCTGTATTVPASCTTTCYVSTTGDDGNTGASASSPVKTLQVALNRVTGGGTVIVAPGLYNPNFTDVTKSVTLLGARQGQSPVGGSRTPTDAGSESIIQSNSGLRILGVGAQVTIDGFTFQEKTVGLSVGVTTGSGSDVGATVTVRNSIFFQMNIGIASSLGGNASSLAISRNLFSGGKTGLSVLGDSQSGSATLSVTGNRFTGLSQKSIGAGVWHAATIDGNTVTGGGAGSSASIEVGGCGGCTVSGNVVDGSAAPSSISVIGFNGAATDTVVRGNTITSAAAAGNVAVLVGLATGTTVEDNTIGGARQAGVVVSNAASSTTVRGNTISGTDAIGVRAATDTFSQPGVGITIARNAISGVRVGIALEKAATVDHNRVAGATEAGVDVTATADPATTRVNRNAIAGNAAGLRSATATAFDATCNWWSAPDGPSGAGGSGDSSSGNATVSPLLASADLDGPCRAYVAIATRLDDPGPLTVGQSTFDTATLHGATPDAGGTVTYRVYTDGGCAVLAPGGDVTPAPSAVTAGAVPDSRPYTFTQPGTYYWQASYSGDDANAAAVSDCASEAISVGERMAALTVSKDFSDDSTIGVPVALTCSSGVVATTDGTASESDPARFTVSGFDAGATCTARESTVPAGYTADASDCDDVPLEARGSCVLRNTKVVAPVPGTIVVRKDAVPDGGQDFGFVGSGGIGSFALDDDADRRLPRERTFARLPVGTYTVTEGVTEKWALAGLVCTDPDGGSGVDVASRRATIDLDAGETVTCVFTNAKQVEARGTIVVRKDAVPDGGQDFGFVGSGGIGSFALEDDGSARGLSGHGGVPRERSFSGLPAGTYTVTEGMTAGWALSKLVCDDRDGGSSVDPASRRATIDLDAGETVTCVFTNAKQAPPPPAAGLELLVDRAVIELGRKRDGDDAVLAGRVKPLGGASLRCGADVTFALGGRVLSQTIPGVRFELTERGTVCRYRRPSRGGGPVRELELDLSRRSWKVSIDDADLRALANPVTVTLTVGDASGSDAIRLRQDGGRWTYER